MEISSTILWVLGMTQPEIEPQSPGPFVNTLNHITVTKLFVLDWNTLYPITVSKQMIMDK